MSTQGNLLIRWMVESLREHAPVDVTSLIEKKRTNLCLCVGLRLVVLLSIEDLVCRIGNVIVQVVVSLCALRTAFGRPRCYFSARLTHVCL